MGAAKKYDNDNNNENVILEEIKDFVEETLKSEKADTHNAIMDLKEKMDKKAENIAKALNQHEANIIHRMTDLKTETDKLIKKYITILVSIMVIIATISISVPIFSNNKIVTEVKQVIQEKENGENGGINTGGDRFPGSACIDKEKLENYIYTPEARCKREE